ncbi:MAG: cation transporter [Sphingomonadales bacterium]|nr:cation transporter [Sphingomonadales bacterium]
MHNHSHSAPQDNMGPRFVAGILLNLVFVFVEFGYGFKINSLSLLADAWHNLGDVAGLIISLFAFKMASKQPTKVYTYGFSKATILASLANCILLFIAITSMGYEAYSRFIDPQLTTGSIVSWVAGIGVIINTATALLFMKNNELNSRAAYLHMAADAGVSLAVLIGGLLTSFTGISMIDPILGILVCMVILFGTVNLFKQSLRLSLDGVPAGIDIALVEARILSIPGVKSIDHLHIWALSTTRNAMTAHLMLDRTLNPTDQEAIKERVRHEIEHEQVHHCILETSLV